MSRMSIRGIRLPLQDNCGIYVRKKIDYGYNRCIDTI